MVLAARPAAIKRGRESREFWKWVVRYRRDSLPTVSAAARATSAMVVILHNQDEVERFVASLERR